jgi:hypothetical protein
MTSSLTRVYRIIFLALLFATAAQPQQIASKDLAQPPIDLSNAKDKREKNDYPNGCKSMATGDADGETLMQAFEPRRITVELVKISTTTFVTSADITGTVKLQNTGDKPIEIPWSTDVRTAQARQDPDHRAWEVGTFRVKLKGKDNYSAELKGTSSALFSSMLVSGSSLTIKPGEWITAQISFKVEAQNPALEKVEVGFSDLIVEWAQTSRTEKVEDCNLMQGFYPYGDSAYQQSNPAMDVKVEADNSNKTKP